MLISSSSREGDEFLVYNHNTEKQYTGAKTIRSMLAPGFLWVLGNAALVALASAIPLSMLNHGEGFLSGVVTALLGAWMIGFSQFVSRVRASRFLGGPVRKQLAAQVAPGG